MTDYSEHQRNVVELAAMLHKQFPDTDPKECGKAAKELYMASWRAFFDALKQL